jgi:molecular chaperone HscA
MPTIQNTVAEFFGKQPLSRLNPDEVVALGAAQTAHQLINGNSDNNLLLLDVTPLSLGLETMGGLVEVLIPRNTPIPVKKRQTFTTYQDGQTGLVVHVVQGERETVENCRSLGRFELYGIPPMKAGFARIEVTFSIDANGQLTVSAQETSTGTESQIEITPSYGLSDEQKEQLLVAGFKHAEEDKNARSLIETKVEAERELLALQSALGEFDSLLTAEAKQALTTQMQALQEALAHDDLANIEAQQAKLKPLSDAFAASIMNQSVKTSMAGTSAKDW